MHYGGLCFISKCPDNVFRVMVNGCTWSITAPRERYKKKKEKQNKKRSILNSRFPWQPVNCSVDIPVSPAGANERVSPQGSVEAQCGLVLNGQGGVIRRGKGLFILSLCLSVRARACVCTVAPEAVSTRGSTRLDSQQTDKQAEQCSLVCCQHVTGAPSCRLFKLTHCTRAWDGAPYFQYEMDCHSTPSVFLSFTSHTYHTFFFPGN